MLRVATVLSAREWEARLVAAARDTAAVKLVLRAFLPDEVSNHADAIDVVVAGSETPWITPTRVAAWRRLGIRVVGLHPRLDRPAAERLAAGGADLVLADDLDAEQIMREIRLLDVALIEFEDRLGSIVAVTGVHGGCGITEVALAVAWNLAGSGPTVLLDGNLAAPSIAVRLGLPPRPDLADLVDRSLEGGTRSLDAAPAIGRLTVIPGSLRRGDTGIRHDAVVDLALAAAAEHQVVIDCGTWPSARHLVREADRAIVVVPGTPIGVVRLARLVEDWDGPQPALVLNSVLPGRQSDLVGAARRWSGLEPDAVIPPMRKVAAAAASGAPPAPSLRKRLLVLGRSDAA
jgi:MinD-like ATPase involved in chromosome partitioning or flagellar assembly